MCIYIYIYMIYMIYIYIYIYIYINAPVRGGRRACRDLARGLVPGAVENGAWGAAAIVC